MKRGGLKDRDENKTTQFAFCNIILIFKACVCVSCSSNYVTFLNDTSSHNPSLVSYPSKLKLVEREL